MILRMSAKRAAALFAAVFLLTMNIKAFENPKTAVVFTDLTWRRGFRCAMPEIRGFEGAEKINRALKNGAADLFGELNGTYNVSGGGYPHKTLGSSCFFYEQRGAALSLAVQYEKLTDKVKSSVIKTFNTDTETGEAYNFIDIFDPKSDFRNISNKFIADEISKNPSKYKYNAFSKIRAKIYDYAFYFEGGFLCICFDGGEISDAENGVTRFKIPAKLLSGCLKEKFLPFVQDNPQTPRMRFCGKEVSDAPPCYTAENGTRMVPLRAVSELLGYAVSWDENLGAEVGGIRITQGSNIFGGTAFSERAAISDGKMYVPESFFDAVLHEYVRGGETVDVYKNNTPDAFLSGVSGFCQPHTAKDCANEYAMALMTGNAALRYALCDDAARELYFDLLSENNWRTEPFQASFSVERRDDLTHYIHFVKADGERFSVSVNIVEYGGVYKIREIAREASF